MRRAAPIVRSTGRACVARRSERAAQLRERAQLADLRRHKGKLGIVLDRTGGLHGGRIDGRQGRAGTFAQARATVARVIKGAQGQRTSAAER